jgi:hypothetical protein
MSAVRLEGQVQNGYTQLESLGAAAELGSPARAAHAQGLAERAASAGAAAAVSGDELQLPGARALVERHVLHACMPMPVPFMARPFFVVFRSSPAVVQAAVP